MAFDWWEGGLSAAAEFGADLRSEFDLSMVCGILILSSVS